MGNRKERYLMREIKVSDQDREAAKKIGHEMNSFSVSSQGVARAIYQNEHPTLIQGIMRVSMQLIWDMAEDGRYHDDRTAASAKIAKAIKKALVEQGLGTEDFPPALPFI
jgi:hypothetical protein